MSDNDLDFDIEDLTQDVRAATEAAPEAVNILVVDDLDDNRYLLVNRLKREGYGVAEAIDGIQALELIEQRPFDLVLLDIMMPRLDGFGVLEELRKTRTMDELPVIMVTAKAESEDVVKAFDLGANDYVSKPINVDVTISRIRAQLQLKHANDLLRSVENSGS